MRYRISGHHLLSLSPPLLDFLLKRECLRLVKTKYSDNLQAVFNSADSEGRIVAPEKPVHFDVSS